LSALGIYVTQGEEVFLCKSMVASAAFYAGFVIEISDDGIAVCALCSQNTSKWLR